MVITYSFLIKNTDCRKANQKKSKLYTKEFYLFYKGHRYYEKWYDPETEYRSKHLEEGNLSLYWYDVGDFVFQAMEKHSLKSGVVSLVSIKEKELPFQIENEYKKEAEYNEVRSDNLNVISLSIESNPFRKDKSRQYSYKIGDITANNKIEKNRG